MVKETPKLDNMAAAIICCSCSRHAFRLSIFNDNPLYLAVSSKAWDFQQMLAFSISAWCTKEPEGSSPFAPGQHLSWQPRSERSKAWRWKWKWDFLCSNSKRQKGSSPSALTLPHSPAGMQGSGTVPSSPISRGCALASHFIALFSHHVDHRMALPCSACMCVIWHHGDLILKPVGLIMMRRTDVGRGKASDQKAYRI